MYSKSTSSGFRPPNAQRRLKALGDLTKECTATAKAVEDIHEYWEPLRFPQQGDWLDSYKHGCCGADEFRGKEITSWRNTLYI